MARILVADDEVGLREFVARALAGKGHDVTAVSDGGEALEALQAGDFDLLVTDIVMPQLDGIALALKAAKDFPALRIVMMTGYEDERQRAYNLDALVHEVVAKPFTLEEICATAEAALAASSG